MPNRPRPALPFPRSCLLAALALLPFAAVQAAVPASERAALQELYSATLGDEWLDNGGWNGPAGSECDWHGVECDASGSTVVAIDLSGNHLQGMLPGTLHQLPNLQRLFLGNNGIGGVITALGPPGLRDVALGSNRFEGPLPELAGFPGLDSFQVENNRLSGPLPSLAGTPGLRYLRVSHNALSGPLPALQEAPQLRVFLAASNGFEGLVPDLDALEALEMFNVAHNRLEGPPPVPAPGLEPGLSRLCPNMLEPLDWPAWDLATGTTPWHRDCYEDRIFVDGFDPAPAPDTRPG